MRKGFYWMVSEKTKKNGARKPGFIQTSDLSDSESAFGNSKRSDP